MCVPRRLRERRALYEALHTSLGSPVVLFTASVGLRDGELF